MTIQATLLARLVRRGLATRGACVWRLRHHLDELLQRPEEARVEGVELDDTVPMVSAATAELNDDATWLLGEHMVGRYRRRIERVSR